MTVPNARIGWLPCFVIVYSRRQLFADAAIAASRVMANHGRRR
jgi:hypothetical protein